MLSFQKELGQPIGYRSAEIWLHDLALRYGFIRKALFHLDCDLFGPSKNILPETNPVFVLGLARSGTSILLEILAATGAFSFLSYKHMPFVTAPVTATRISNLRRKNLDARERAHGDGIKISLKSPESFEEVIWQTLGAADTRSGLYNFRTPTNTMRQGFDAFRGQVILSNHRHPTANRYLSKNNNNIGRIDILAKIPKAAIFFLYPKSG